jgi:hypothetical protein
MARLSPEKHYAHAASCLKQIERLTREAAKSLSKARALALKARKQHDPTNGAEVHIKSVERVQ